MFGQNNNHNDNDNDSAKIPDQSIDDALNDQTVNAPNSNWGHPGKPLDDSTDPPADNNQAEPTNDGTPTVVTPTTTPSTVDDTANDLIDIKQQALGQLAPLVDQLDQSPEERFRTTMMMIQASDNQALIKDAYTAAQAITNEKARAQALLDIVNEINYFTQQHTE